MISPVNQLLLAAGLLGTAALAPATGLFAPASLTAGEAPSAQYDIDVIHPEADSFSAFQGRAVLVEFFAHW